MTAWLAIGPPDNWEIALENRVWGFSEENGLLWQKIASGDLLFFHATRPVRGIIGYGKVFSRFVQEEPFWPQEVRTGRMHWPLGVKFEVMLSIPKEQWVAKAIHLKKGVGFQRALQRLEETIYEGVIRDLETSKD